jgi:hypothetical protein
MSTITKALALAAFVGVLGASGFASAKTHPAAKPLATPQVQPNNGQYMQGTNIPSWMSGFEKSSNGSKPPPGASGSRG